MSIPTSFRCGIMIGEIPTIDSDLTLIDPNRPITPCPQKMYYSSRYFKLDFTKENFIELPFNELPIKVQNLFRQFEEQEGFKISEGVSFNIDNMF